MNIIKDKQIVWEVPAGTQEVTVEIFNADNSFKAAYTISNYITMLPGEKLRVTAK